MPKLQFTLVLHSIWNQSFERHIRRTSDDLLICIGKWSLCKILLSYLVLLNLFACQTTTYTTPPTISAHLLDYIHQATINQTFYEADFLKWQGSYQHAFETYQQIDTTILNTKEKLYLKNQQVYVLLKLHKKEKAALLLKDLTLNAITEIKKHKEINGDYLLNMALFNKEHQEIKKSLAHYKAAKTVLEQVYGKNHYRYAECLNEIGMIYRFYTPYTDSSFVYINQAFEIANTIPNINHLMGHFYFAKSNIARLKRDYINCLVYAELALEIAKKLKNPDAVFLARCYAVKGHALKKRKQLVPATDAFDRAFEIGLNNSKEQLTVQEVFRESIIHCLYLKEEDCFWEKLSILESRYKSNQLTHINLDELKGYYYYLKEEHDSTLVYYNSFLEGLAPTSFSPFTPQLTNAYWILMKTNLALRQYEAAKKYVSENLFLHFPSIEPSLSLKKSLTSILLENETNYVNFSQLANVYYSQYQDEQNINALKNAFKVQTFIDSIFFKEMNLVEEDAVLEVMSGFGKEFYNIALATAYELYRKEEKKIYLEWGNIFMERLKSYLMYQEFVSRKKEFTILIPQDSLEKEKNLKRKIKSIKLKLINDPSNWNKSRLKEALQAQRKLHDYFEETFPDYSQTKTKQILPNIKKIKDYCTQSEEAFLQYQFGKENIYYIFIATDTVLFNRIDNSQKIAEQIFILFDFLEHQRYGDTAKKQYYQTAHFLFKELIAPIYANLIATKQLVLFTDGPLSLIAFDVLLTEPVTANANFKTLPYLVKGCPIKYASSLKNYFSKNQRAVNLTENLNILGYAFSGKNEQPSQKNLPFSILKYSPKELLDIQKYFPVANRIFREGIQSTRHAFFNDILDKDIIHLSLHAQSSFQNRLDNKIIFNNITPEENTVLGYEIGALTLNKSPLVVLSACQSAFGTDHLGEGTYSLTRSFLQAGASQVIASLWQADEYSNYLIFSFFYKELAKEHSVWNALRKAKLQYLEEKDAFATHPGKWGHIGLFL